MDCRTKHERETGRDSKIYMSKKLAVQTALGDIDGMSKKDLVKLVKDNILPLTDPEKYKEMVRSSQPEFVREMNSSEDLGTSAMQAAQEMMLAIVETLKINHHFSDEMTKKFLKNLQGNMKVVEKVEENGLSMLSDNSMKHIIEMTTNLGVAEMVGEIAKIRYQKEQTWRTGLEYPNHLEGSKIERQLQKPRK